MNNTISNTHFYSCNISSYTPPGNPQSTPTTRYEEYFEDSDDLGFSEPTSFKNKETNVHRPGYKDWTLFNKDLNIVAGDVNTGRFFADADASVVADQGSVSEGYRNESVAWEAEQGQEVSGNEFYGPVQEAVQGAVKASAFETVRAATQDYESWLSRPSLHYEEDSSILKPLEKWAITYERHESIAYRLEQPAYPTQYYQQQPIYQHQ